MKLYGQHGAQAGQKIDEGLAVGHIDGVVLSPRDVRADRLAGMLEGLAENHEGKDRLFDPQFYACFLATDGESRLRYLEEDYSDYFQPFTRRALERESEVVKVLRKALRFQADLDLTASIAPNIIIPRSLNSIEAVIAKNFIRNAAAAHRRLRTGRPLYATLAISRDALLDKQDLTDFMNEITMLDNPPDGFYLLVGTGSPDARGQVYNADILSAWMLLNHSFKVNGFAVVNGYSDLITPLLGAAGADAGCTGWFSNLRTFSLARFRPSSGGRLPTPRYLSKKLLNRINFYELDQLRSRFGHVLNGLDTDGIFPEDGGSEPQRKQEILQSWQALKSLNGDLVAGNIPRSLRNWANALNEAEELYGEIRRTGIALDTKSNGDHIDPLREALRLFARAAEIEPPSEL